MWTILKWILGVKELKTTCELKFGGCFDSLRLRCLLERTGEKSDIVQMNTRRDNS